MIDTVGAGVFFIAAFLFDELQGKPHKGNLRRTCDVGVPLALTPAQFLHPPVSMRSLGFRSIRTYSDDFLIALSKFLSNASGLSALSRVTCPAY